MLDREDFRRTLIELLEAETGEDFADLPDSAQLRVELGLDSVDVVGVIAQIERRFRIRLSHEELEKLVTVKDVLDLVLSKIAASDTQAA